MRFPAALARRSAADPPSPSPPTPPRLDKTIDEIVVDDKGKFVGVRSGDETVKADALIGDPTYFQSLPVGGKNLVRETAKVVRAICLLKHPVPNTDNSDSVQLIIPQNQVGRKHGE